MELKPKSTEMIEMILDAVAEELDIPVESLTKKGYSKRKYVEGRQVAMYMARKFTSMTYKEIVHIFPVSDHTTVLYGVRAIESMMEYDNRVMTATSRISSKIMSLSEMSNKAGAVYYTIFDGQKSKGIYVSEKAAMSFLEPGKRIIPLHP
jgi:hypothetical protein